MGVEEILPKDEPVWFLKAGLETRPGGGADSKYGSCAWASEVHPEKLSSPQAWRLAVPITAWRALGRLFRKSSNRDLRGLEDRVLELQGHDAFRTQLYTVLVSPAHRSLPSCFCSALIRCSRFNRYRAPSSRRRPPSVSGMWKRPF